MKNRAQAHEDQSDVGRLIALSDGVFAVAITILVLELKPPRAATPESLLALWPTGLSYAISYLFIAVVWVNHHHLLRFAEAATPRLIWSNFAHLFQFPCSRSRPHGLRKPSWRRSR